VPLRVLGVVLGVLGLAITGFGIYGAIRGPGSAAVFDAVLKTFESSDFVYSAWLERWRLWGVGFACAGAAIAVGGAAVTLQRRWGFLVLAFAFFAAAIAPWILQWLQLVRFAFESPDLLETIVYSALSGFAAFGYFYRPRQTDA
jgi:hypothetical protein